MEIWNCSQKSTISNLNMSTKDGKYQHCHKKKKKQSEISINQERKFQKLGFEEIIPKSTLYVLVNFLPHCVPLLLAPLTLPFKNFNRVMFTMYYIKKTAANFTLNRVLLMLNAYFFFNKKILLSIYYVYYYFSDIKKITSPPKFF